MQNSSARLVAKVPRVAVVILCGYFAVDSSLLSALKLLPLIHCNDAASRTQSHREDLIQRSSGTP